jgi:hypothetical protein
MKVHEVKILVAGGLVVLMCLTLAAQARQSEDSSLLRPSDIAYADATGFAQFLNQHDITVKSIHRSKLESFFRGVNKAAFFKTDKGILEVIFFPDSGAERVSSTERRENGRFIYSFRGQPQPNPPGDTINAARRMYFITHDSWFIVTSDERTSNAVKSLF